MYQAFLPHKTKKNVMQHRYWLHAFYTFFFFNLTVL